MGLGGGSSPSADAGADADSQLCRRPGHGHSGGPCRGYQALLRWRCGGGHFGGSHGHRQCEPSQGLRAEGGGHHHPYQRHRGGFH